MPKFSARSEASTSTIPEIARWSSTAWRGDTLPAVAPTGYVAPVMQWFRGSNATVTQYEDRIVADAVIDIQRK